MANKRVSILILCLAISIAITEIFVAKVIRYPAYGVEYKVRYRIGGGYWTNIRRPHSRLYNVEGRILTGYNNLGLPGIDIRDTSYPIAVLGSSYVEALQLAPEQIATSEFQKLLKDNYKKETVLNLGCSGHDPYDSWFRLKYFESLFGFRTEDVILVLNSDDEAWFKRHPQPFSFDLPKDFGNRNTNTKVKYMIALRNSSSLIEIMAKWLKSDDDPGERTAVGGVAKAGEVTPKDLSQEMRSCLDALSMAYKHFAVVSIYNNATFNNALADYCQANGINHIISPIAKPRQMFNGSGHLNDIGNKQLGKLLFEAYQQANMQ